MPLFQHEYGHYLQSRRFGWGYLSKVGLPSLFSATGDNDHEYYTVEQDANARAIKHFNKTGVLKTWYFKDNPIGMGNWDVTNNVYREGTREFTDEFNAALNKAHMGASFWDFFSGANPMTIFLTGYGNHRRNGWVDKE